MHSLFKCHMNNQTWITCTICYISFGGAPRWCHGQQALVKNLEDFLEWNNVGMSVARMQFENLDCRMHKWMDWWLNWSNLKQEELNNKLHGAQTFISRLSFSYPAFYDIQRVITMFTWDCHCVYPKPDEFNSHHICLGSTVVPKYTQSVCLILAFRIQPHYMLKLF